MNIETLNIIRQHIIDSELQPPYPYLDTKGSLTIGTGFHIETEKEFLSLPLTSLKTGKPATEDEKRAEFANMNRLREEQASAPGKFNRSADKYENDTTLRMPKVEQDKLLDEEINTRVEQISKDVGADAWGKLSDGQKAAIVDVHYATGSLKDFPALKQAIKDGKVEDMARESIFYTNSKTGTRNMDRLTRNRMAFIDEDKKTARAKIEEQVGASDTASKPDQADDEGDDKDKDEGEITGASGVDELANDEAGKQSHRHEIDDFMEQLKKPVDAVSEILMKEPASWTEQEVNQVHGSDAYQSPSDPRRSEVVSKVKDWYEQHYGNEQVKVDDTGKTVPPTFVKAPPKKPVAVKGKDGKPVMDDVLGAGAKIADVAGKNGLATAIRGAQIGVNLLNKFQDGNKGNAGTGTLKTDGLFGPKTNKALRDSVAGVGRPKVENAVSLGTFQNLLEKKPGGLAEAAHDSFSGLFQKPSSFKAADKQPSPWGMVVQDTLNDIGGDSFGPLKSDGWIGPKTTDAFRHMVKPTGVGGFMQKLGANFGFF